MLTYLILHHAGSIVAGRWTKKHQDADFVGGEIVWSERRKRRTACNLWKSTRYINYLSGCWLSKDQNPPASERQHRPHCNGVSHSLETCFRLAAPTNEIKTQHDSVASAVIQEVALDELCSLPFSSCTVQHTRFTLTYFHNHTHLLLSLRISPQSANISFLRKPIFPVLFRNGGFQTQTRNFRQAMSDTICISLSENERHASQSKWRV
jgi:hypothetical protein